MKKLFCSIDLLGGQNYFLLGKKYYLKVYLFLVTLEEGADFSFHLKQFKNQTNIGKNYFSDIVQQAVQTNGS
jgi:hypothetical protein